MNNDMKCPVCGEKIEHIEDGWCNCKNRCLGSGSIDLWLNFIRTSRALDVAVDALDVISQITNQIDVCDTANDALNTIASFKQKDKR